jgi:hypothetical protein
MGKISGCMAVAATLISCWGLAPFAKKARRPSGKVEAITLQFKRIFRNKKFLKVITLYILLWCALQLMQNCSFNLCRRCTECTNIYCEVDPDTFPN